MAITGRPKAPTSFWIIAALSLLFNTGGAFDYLMTQTENARYMADFTPAQIAYFTGLPGWYVAIWALGVWGAFFGSVLLLARSRHAVTALGIGIAGLLLSTIGSFLTDLPASLDTAGYWGFAVIIWIIELLLFFYARQARRRGILQ